MNLNLVTMKALADTLLSSYGKPVAEGWSRYSIGRSIGWAVGWAIGTILFIAAIWIAINIIPSLITATIAPDMYWLVEIMSK